MSKSRLDKWRDEHIMISVARALESLKRRLQLQARAAGVPVPHERRFAQMQAGIFDLVNSELRVLAAEGKAAERNSLIPSDLIIPPATPASSAVLSSDVRDIQAVAHGPSFHLRMISDGAEQTVGTSLVSSETQEQRAARRQAFITPILRSKHWTRCRWASAAGVSKNSVYRYLDGTRGSITGANRQALADALGVKKEELPG